MVAEAVMVYVPAVSGVVKLHVAALLLTVAVLVCTVVPSEFLRVKVTVVPFAIFAVVTVTLAPVFFIPIPDAGEKVREGVVLVGSAVCAQIPKDGSKQI